MAKGWKFIISGLWVLTHPPLSQSNIYHEMKICYVTVIYCSPTWLPACLSVYLGAPLYIVCLCYLSYLCSFLR